MEQRLTAGTTTSPSSIASIPALIGEVKYGLMKVLPVNVQYMQAHMTPTPVMKEAQTDAGVVRFQYKPYRNGARKAPASAPHEIPMSWAMKVTELLAWMMASTEEMMMKKSTSRRMQSSCLRSSRCLSLRALANAGSMISSVKVDPEVSTSEDRVDMEAESTRMMTTPIIRSGREASMEGTMLS